MKNRIFVSRPCPSADDWQALLAGNLPTSRIEEIEAHLDGCLVCVARLDALTPSLPEELWDAALEPATVTPEWAARCHGWTEVESPSEPADDGPLLFERKGKYKSHGPIAFGGMGEVYRAWEIGLDRWVAIKIPSRARRSPNAITRFLEEAPRQVQLEHENIVRVYARDEQDGIPFFAMELVTGETLAKASREPEDYSPKRVAELIRQVATAVHCAQDRSLPPRLEAYKHNVDSGRHPQGRRLWPGEDARRTYGPEHGWGSRHRRVHGPRTVGGRPCVPARASRRLWSNRRLRPGSGSL